MANRIISIDEMSKDLADIWQEQLATIPPDEQEEFNRLMVAWLMSAGRGEPEE